MLNLYLLSRGRRTRTKQRSSQAGGAKSAGQHQPLCVRPVTPEDTALLADLIGRLSETARRMRYFRPLPRAELVWREASQVMRREPQLGVALVATASADSRVRAIALAELAHDPAEPAAAELAALVHDDVQRKGVGTLLLREIVALARQRNVRTLLRACREGGSPSRPPSLPYYAAVSSVSTMPPVIADASGKTTNSCILTLMKCGLAAMRWQRSDVP